MNWGVVGGCGCDHQKVCFNNSVMVMRMMMLAADICLVYPVSGGSGYLFNRICYIWHRVHPDLCCRSFGSQIDYSDDAWWAGTVRVTLADQDWAMHWTKVLSIVLRSFEDAVTLVAAVEECAVRHGDV